MKADLLKKIRKNFTITKFRKKYYLWRNYKSLGWQEMANETTLTDIRILAQRFIIADAKFEYNAQRFNRHKIIS